MKNIISVKERYLREPLNRRIGHLASNLARLSVFLENPKNRKATEDILEESKFFIEWTASEAQSEMQAMLSEIQSKLALWQRHLLQQKENSDEIEESRKLAKSWSTHLIEISELLTV